MRTQAYRFAYFAYFGYLGAWGPWWPIHLEQNLRFDKKLTGILCFLVVVSLIAGGLLLGRLADATRSRRRLMRIVSAAGALSSLLWWVVESPVAAMALAIAQGATAHTLLPLLDSSCIDGLGADRARFGKIRLFGTAGWGVLNAAVGFVTKSHPSAVIAGMAGSLAMFCAAAWMVDNTQVRAAGAAHPRLDGRAAVRNAGFLILLLSAFLHRFAFAPSDFFFTLHLRSIGFSDPQIVDFLTAGIASELLVFFAAPVLLRRFPAEALLAFSIGVTALRWWITPHLRSFPALTALQVTHGVSFGLWYASGLHVLGRIVRREVSTTGQALFGIASASGVGLGAALAGAVWESQGPVTTWHGSALVAGAATLLLVAGYRALRAAPPVGARSADHDVAAAV